MTESGAFNTDGSVDTVVSGNALAVVVGVSGGVV